MHFRILVKNMNCSFEAALLTHALICFFFKCKKKMKPQTSIKHINNKIKTDMHVSTSILHLV